MNAAQLKLEDDARDKSVADVREEAVVAVPEASGAGGSLVPVLTLKEAGVSKKAEGDSPELTDQTNFLPTRQVRRILAVFCTLGPNPHHWHCCGPGHYRISWAIDRPHVLVLGPNHVSNLFRDYVEVERRIGVKSCSRGGSLPGQLG